MSLLSPRSITTQNALFCYVPKVTQTRNSLSEATSASFRTSFWRRSPTTLSQSKSGTCGRHVSFFTWLLHPALAHSALMNDVPTVRPGGAMSTHGLTHARRRGSRASSSHVIPVKTFTTKVSSRTNYGGPVRNASVSTASCPYVLISNSVSATSWLVRRRPDPGCSFETP